MNMPLAHTTMGAMESKRTSVMNLAVW